MLLAYPPPGVEGDEGEGDEEAGDDVLTESAKSEERGDEEAAYGGLDCDVDVSGGADDKEALASRQKLIKQFDSEGIMATPANSSYNELVTEAARLSVLNDGRRVEITYGENSGVDFYK